MEEDGKNYLTTGEASEVLKKHGLHLSKQDVALLAQKKILPDAFKGADGTWRILEGNLDVFIKTRKKKYRVKSLVAAILIAIPICLALPSFVKDGKDIVIQQSFEDSLVVDISVLNSGESYRINEWGATTKHIVYISSETSDGLYVRPIGSFDDLVPFITGNPYEFNFPELDIKLTNNSSETKFIKEIILHVFESDPDLRPIPKIMGTEVPYEFNLENWGYGPILGGCLYVTPLHLNKTVKYDLGTIDSSESQTFDTSKVVEIAGGDPLAYKTLLSIDRLRSDTDPDLIRAVGSSLTESSNGELRIKNVLECEFKIVTKYNAPSGMAEDIVIKYNGLLVLNGFDGAFGNGEVEDTAHFLLPISQKNYYVSYPISVPLKAKDISRVSIKIGAKRSSIHNFDIELACTDGTSIRSKPIQLSMFINSAAAYKLENAKEQFSENR